jgi:hypothetical protein
MANQMAKPNKKCHLTRQILKNAFSIVIEGSVTLMRLAHDSKDFLTRYSTNQPCTTAEGAYL